MLSGDGGLGKPHFDHLPHLWRHKLGGNSILCIEGDRRIKRLALQLRNHQVSESPRDYKRTQGRHFLQVQNTNEATIEDSFLYRCWGCGAGQHRKLDLCPGSLQRSKFLWFSRGKYPCSSSSHQPPLCSSWGWAFGLPQQEAEARMICTFYAYWSCSYQSMKKRWLLIRKIFLIEQYLLFLSI